MLTAQRAEDDALTHQLAALEDLLPHTYYMQITPEYIVLDGYCTLDELLRFVAALTPLAVQHGLAGVPASPAPAKGA